MFYTDGGMGGIEFLLAQRLLALGQVLLVQHRRQFLAKLLLEGLRRVGEALGLELGLALDFLGRLGLADVEALLDRLAALERLLEGGEGVGALRECSRSASMASGRRVDCVRGAAGVPGGMWADALTAAPRSGSISGRPGGVGGLSTKYGREGPSGTLQL